MATPRGRQPLGQLKQPNTNTDIASSPPVRRLHRFGDSLEGTPISSLITGFKDEDFEGSHIKTSPLSRPGRPIPDFEGSSPFYSVKSDEVSRSVRKTPLRMPLRHLVSGDGTPMGKEKAENRRELSSSIGRPSVDNLENKTTEAKAEWAPWGYRKDVGRGSATRPVIQKHLRDNHGGNSAAEFGAGAESGKSKLKLSPVIPIPKPSRIPSLSHVPSLSLPSSSSNRQQQAALSSGGSFTQRAVRRASQLSSSWNLPLLPGRRRAGSNASSSVVASSPSVQRMSAISTGTSRRVPSFSSDNLDTAEVIDPTASASPLLSNTIRNNNSANTTTTSRKAEPQQIKNKGLIMADKKGFTNNRASMGGSFYNQKATPHAEAAKQVMSPIDEKPQLKMKTSTRDHPNLSTGAKQLMPQLNTSQRKYNPRASMGNLAGNLRAPASLATVAMSNFNATPSVCAMEIETQAFYDKLWPGMGITPEENKGGSMFHQYHPNARNTAYLRNNMLTTKEVFLQEFGHDQGANFADFGTAWDMVEAKYGKPKEEVDAEQHHNSTRPLPTLRAPMPVRVSDQTEPDAEKKKTHTQHIVSGFKKSISKTGLSNLVKVPSMMALPTHNNSNGRSTSGPAAFESSKPIRSQSPSEVFTENSLYPDDDFRCVRIAMSQVYWAGRFSSANARRMNEPGEFAASIATAVKLSKRSQGGVNCKVFQDMWDQQWNEHDVARALDVFNELNEWCKTVEARRSLREYKIHLAREMGWHVLLPAGVPIKEPPASGMARMAGKMMGRGEMSIKEMQLQFRETRETNRVAGTLVKRQTKQQFRPRCSILGLHENGIPGYESGVAAALQQSSIPVFKGGKASPRVHTPTKAYSSSPVQTVQSKSSSTQHGSGGTTTGRTWYGRKKPAVDDTPRPLAMARAAATAGTKAKENANPAMPTLTQSKPKTREEKKREKNQELARKEFDERLELILEQGPVVAPMGVWRSRVQEERFGLDRR